jgi:hypothetical protein
MSRETSELNAIENLFESKWEQILKILAIEDFDCSELNVQKFCYQLRGLIWKAAEDEFGERGGYE